MEFGEFPLCDQIPRTGLLCARETAEERAKMQKHNRKKRTGLKRSLDHLSKGGCITAGLEHVLVILPSSLLLAKYANTESGPLITLPMILFSCGAATLFFTFVMKPKAPFFLGPSISYIAFLRYQASLVSQGHSVNHVRTAIFLAYLIAGGFLFFLSLAYKGKRVSNGIHTLFPYTVMGPAISLIGLQVIGTAVSDAGLNGDDNKTIAIALLTLFVIIVGSLARIRWLRNASVLFGVIAGCTFSFF